MPDHTCKDCRFWESGTNIGTCRRHAPAAGPHIDGEDAQAMWPRTEDKDWCGELELRSDHPDRLSDDIGKGLGLYA